MVVAHNKGISCGGMVTAPWRALSAALEMAEIIAFSAFWSTALATILSGINERNFIVLLTIFSLLD